MSGAASFSGTDIFSGAGNDLIVGSTQDDEINSGSGDDLVVALAGKDTINGGIAFNNFGTVNIDSGILALNGGGDATGGIFNIGLGATLRFNAAYGLGLTTTLAGAGTIDFVSGVQTISGPYNVTGTTSVSGRCG